MRPLVKPSRLVLSLTMTALLASTSMLTACTGFQKQPPRYNTVAGAKRAPVLNPGGANYIPPEMQAAEDGTMPVGMMNEVPPAPMPQPVMMAPQPMPAPVVPEAGRKVPLGNQQAMAAEMPPAMMMAEPMPMEPVKAAELQSPEMAPPAYAPPAPMSAPAAVQPEPSALAMGTAPQPSEPVAYQPMTNENGEFPTLQEVPPVPSGMEERASGVRQEAADFTNQSAQLPPLGEVASPAPAPAALPSYEQELHSSVSPAPVEPEPVALAPAEQPTPLQQAGNTYDAYYEAQEQQQPSVAPAPVSGDMPAGEPLPTYEPMETAEEANPVEPQPVDVMQPMPMETAENVYEEPAYEAAPSGLPPIQLRAPSGSAGGVYGAGVQGSDVLPQSRYSGRTVYSRPGVMRH